MQNEEPLSGNLLLDDSLQKSFKEHLRKSEGVEERIHFDDNDVLSVGVGIALGDQSGLFSREDINRRLAWTGADIKLNDKDFSLIQEATLEDRYKERNKILGSVSISLNETQINRQLEVAMRERLTAAERNAQKAGVNLASLPNGVKLAVADLTYRGGTKLVLGKKADGSDFNGTKHLKEGNFGAFYAEVLYGSNAKGFAGNDRRNFGLVREALSEMTPAQRQKAMKELNNFRQQSPEMVKKIHARIGEYNDRVPEHLRIPLEELNEDTGFKGSESSPDRNNPDSSKGGAGDPVHVDAHTRDGHSVKAHTRDAPD